jgi:photosystem II stability/assembly factor-like uncharacterized protein
VCFTSVRNGWAGGGDGKLVHTADGGLHWKLQLAGDAILALSFPDSSNGWVTTAHNVYHTTDGGAHWLPAAPTPHATWVHALTPLDAVIGTGQGIARTFDGGATWQQSTSAADDYFSTLKALQFVDAANGWAIGAGGEILATANGGVTWAAQASTTTQGLNAVHFIDASTGWAVGDQGTVVHTTDAGAHWTAQTSGVGDDLTGVAFTDAQNGWASGITYYQGSDSVTGVIIHTSDGGQHWTTQATPVPYAGLSDVAFADSLHGWSVGEVQGDSVDNVTVILGTINGGTTWTEQHSYNPPEVGNTGDGVLNGVACTDAEHAVAVGGGSGASEIFRTVNGGVTWTRLVKPAAWSVYLTDVVFTDGGHGWAIGQGPVTVGAGTVIIGGTVIATTDGGATWTKLLVPGNLGSEPLDAISFVNPTRGWVAGGGADILTTTTAGHTP